MTKRGQKIEALEFGRRPVGRPTPTKPLPADQSKRAVADSKTGQLRLRVVEGDEA